MKKQIQFDYSFCMQDSIGKQGFRVTDLKKYDSKLKQINNKFNNDYNQEYMSFNNILDNTKEVLAVKYTSNKLKRNFNNLVVIGIGGSDLGGKAIINSLKSKYHNELPKKERGGMKIYFIGDSTDPVAIKELLDIIDLKETAFHVISKSGNTIETLSVFNYVKEKLIRKVGKVQHRHHIIVTTQDNNGMLYEISKKENYLILPHDTVGGRFAVLSSVGLLAATCAGLNIDNIIQGAFDLRNLLKRNSYKTNSVFTYALINYLTYTQKKKNINILMPYNSKFIEFGNWFKQLWAESLGKNGGGQTPVKAFGPKDQHSQLQLYEDGPNDKIITFIKIVENLDIVTPQTEYGKMDYFSNTLFKTIINMELEATSLSLMKGGKMNSTIILPELSEYYIGQLFYFFELAVAYSGELYGINAFDQLGVEQSKKYLHAMLGKKELKETKRDLNKMIKNIKKYKS